MHKLRNEKQKLSNERKRVWYYKNEAALIKNIAEACRDENPELHHEITSLKSKLQAKEQELDDARCEIQELWNRLSDCEEIETKAGGRYTSEMCQ